MRLSESQIQEINYAYSYYRKADLKDLAHKMENDLLNDSISLFSLLPISPNVDRFNDIKRVTINKTVNEDKSNSRLFFIENLKYPPLRIVYKLGYNRASFKEQSIFYGGFGSQLQLLFENPPEIGDKITLSTWKQKNNSDLCFVSIFHDEIIQQKSNLFEADWKHFQEELSHLDPKTREALRKLFSLVTYFFMRPVKKENSIEYIFSAYIADKIFKMNYSPKIEAILYPSVPVELIGCNIAILPQKFDEKFQLHKVEEFEVLSSGFKQIIYNKTGESIKFIGEKLVWK